MAKFSMLGAMGAYMDEKAREIVKIDLDDIVDDENNDFEVEGGTEIEKKNALLKDSIEQFGLLDPLTVRPTGDGKYKLISGHRRKLAHARLVAEGKEAFRKVDCIIKEAGDDDAEQMLIEANIPNRVVSDWEKLQAVKRLNAIYARREAAGEKIPGRRREHIAEALGMSTSAVGRLENIDKNLSSEYKEELKAGAIGVSVADKLASKSKKEQADIHAAKGAKVKLVDLNDKKEPEKPKESERREWAIKLQGVPEGIGELKARIWQEGNSFWAGFWYRLGQHGEPVERRDMEHRYASYDAAFDGAVEYMQTDDNAATMLELKEEQKTPPPIEQPAPWTQEGQSLEARIKRLEAEADGLQYIIGEMEVDWHNFSVRANTPIDGKTQAALQCAMNRMNVLMNALHSELVRKRRELQDAQEELAEG